MVLNPKQINELVESIRKLHWVFVAQNFGTNFVPKDVLKDLKKWGIKEVVVKSYPEYAFHFGLLSIALKHKGAKKINFKQLKKFISSGEWLPLTKWERYGLSLIENRLVDNITGLGNKVSSDFKTILIEADLKQRKQFEKIIRGEAKDVFTSRGGVKKLVSQLGHKTKDWTRDFGRISDFILHEAYDNGRAYGILRHYNGDADKALVYKNVYNQACSHCKRLYLEYDRKAKDFKPKIFKLSELLTNGSNVGRKVNDWKPVIGATHPWCRCTLEYVQPNSNWDYKLKRFVTDEQELVTFQGLDLRKFIKVTYSK